MSLASQRNNMLLLKSKTQAIKIANYVAKMLFIVDNVNAIF